MHKKLSFLALPLVLPLIAGCGGSDVNVDKVNLKDVLSSKEAQVVLVQAIENLSSFSKITDKGMYYENDGVRESTTEYSYTTVAYKDNAIYNSGETKSKWSDPSGFAFEKTTKDKGIKTLMIEDSKRYPVDYNENNEEVEMYVYSKLDEGEDPGFYAETVEYHATSLYNAISEYDDTFFVVKNGKGYKAILSSYGESVTPDKFGNDTAIHHTVTFNRQTWEINEKFQVTSFKSQHVEQDNIDQFTGEYLEKAKDVLRDEEECKFEYKDRANKDKNVIELEKKILGNRFANAGLEIRLVDENKNEVDNASVTSEHYSVKFLSLNKVKIDFVYMTGGLTDFKGIGLEAKIYFTNKLDKLAEKTEVVKKIPFTGEGITVDGDYGMYAEAHDSIYVAFSATAEIVNNDVVITPTTAVSFPVSIV